MVICLTPTCEHGSSTGFNSWPPFILLFLNDLSSVAESCEKTNMFADDAEIDTAEKPECHEDLQNNLNSDLHKIKDYLNYNRLKFKHLKM